MQHTKFFIFVIALLVLFGLVGYFRFAETGANTLWSISNSGKWLLPLVAVAALIDSVNPCAFSILLLTIAFLFTLGKSRREIFHIGGVYIIGIFTAYILIGLGILHALHLFGVPHFMAKVGALILIVWGALEVLNGIFPKFPLRLGIPRAAHHQMAILMEKGSVPAAFLLGGLVGLCEFPCTGGPYLMILGLLHDSATYLQGFGYLILYNGIFVLPLVLILFLASDKMVAEKIQQWRNRESRGMRLWTGIAMGGLAILILLL
jgi:cytochrome c-type biogenesis protein